MIPDSVIRLISSPLAPHSPAPMTFPRLVKLFGTLLSSGEDEIVSFVGDFSRGTIVLTMMLDVLKTGPEINGPTKMVLIASFVDLRFSNSKIGEVERYDPVLRLPIEIETAKSWADLWDLSDPRLSPVRAELVFLNEGHVKMHGLIGGCDILTHDTLLFQEKCQASGVSGE